MMFQVVHTHTNETCPARSAEQAKLYHEWWQSMKNTPGVKVIGGYVCPIDHTFYITVEANNYPVLAKALGALNTIGTGQIKPILALDQSFPMAEAGAFRSSKQ